MFVKTHYPLISPTVGALTVKKAIVCVRNPIDTLASYFQFKLTYSHTKSVDPKFLEEHIEEWDWFLKEVIDMWK